jgi:hypothetical protein
MARLASVAFASSPVSVAPMGKSCLERRRHLRGLGQKDSAPRRNRPSGWSSAMPKARGNKSLYVSLS